MRRVALGLMTRMMQIMAQRTEGGRATLFCYLAYKYVSIASHMLTKQKQTNCNHIGALQDMQGFAKQ